MLYSVKDQEELNEILKNLSFSFNKSPQVQKINFLIAEFGQMNFSIEMIKKGIEQARNELDYEPTFKQLKFYIQKFAPVLKVDGCEKCDFSGFRTMIKNNLEYAFCCDCEKGLSYRFHHKVYQRRIYKEGEKDGYLLDLIPEGFKITIESIKRLYDKFFNSLTNFKNMP